MYMGILGVLVKISLKLIPYPLIPPKGNEILTFQGNREVWVFPSTIPFPPNYTPKQSNKGIFFLFLH